MKRATVIRTLWHWHRRVGLVACVLILILSVTGIMLNHSPGLGWDHRQISSHWILQSYGFEPPEAYDGVLIDGHYWVMSDTQLFRDGERIDECFKPWHSIVNAEGLVAAACSEKIVLFEMDGELLETLSALPETGLHSIGLNQSEQGVLLQFAQNQYLLNLNSMEVTATRGKSAIAPETTQVPDDLAQELSSEFRVQDLTWERFILDVHAGRWFGGWGWLLMDLGAIFMVLLSLSGVFMYLLRRTRQQSKR